MRLVRLISKAERSREIAIEASHAAIRRRRRRRRRRRPPLRLRLRLRRPHFPRHSRHRRRSQAERRETRSCTLSSGRPRSQRSEIVFALRCRRLVTRSFSHLLLISARMRFCRPTLHAYAIRRVEMARDWRILAKCSWLAGSCRGYVDDYSPRKISRTYEKEKKFGYVLKMTDHFGQALTNGCMCRKDLCES